MKSNCFQKFVNTFTNEDENHILNELYSDRVNDRDEIMTIRKLQIDNIDQSTM